MGFVVQRQRGPNDEGAFSLHAGNQTRRLTIVQVPDMMAMDMIETTNKKCKGRPLSGWGGLGKNLPRMTCQQKCLADLSCMFAVYRKKNGACTSFASCEDFTSTHGFTVLSRQTTFIDFGTSLASMIESCSDASEQPTFKTLGCRGTDSRCMKYNAPNMQNKKPCKDLRLQGADCTWAKEDPTGSCTGHDSRCGQDTYKTQWKCMMLQKSGVSCAWKKHQVSLRSNPNAENMKKQVVEFITQLNLYIPNLHLDMDVLLPLLGESVSAVNCKLRTGAIERGIAAYADALKQLQLALNTMTPVETLPDVSLEVAGTSELGIALDGFKKAYAPKVFGCTGYHSECTKQTTPKSCKKIVGDCAWALTQQQSGNCEGSDSRCSQLPRRHWKEGCDILTAEKASCSWKAKETYVSDSARLVDMLRDIGAHSALDFQHVASADFEQRMSAIQASVAVVDQTLLALKRALGMID